MWRCRYTGWGTGVSAGGNIGGSMWVLVVLERLWPTATPTCFGETLRDSRERYGKILHVQKTSGSDTAKPKDPKGFPKPCLLSLCDVDSSCFVRRFCGRGASWPVESRISRNWGGITGGGAEKTFRITAWMLNQDFLWSCVATTASL